MSRKKGGKKGGKRRRPAGPQDGGPAVPERPSPSGDAGDLRRAAKAQVRTTAAALRALRLPPEVEPAFVFRP
jgi:hypothetical protein